MARPAGGDDPLGDVDLLDLHVRVGPVVVPVAVDPHVRLAGPAFGAIAGVAEPPRRLPSRQGGDLHVAVIGPACQRHRPVGEEQLHVRRARRLGEAAAREPAEVGDALCLQIRLEHLAAGLLVQRGARGRAVKAPEHLPADDADLLAGPRAVHDRRLGRPRVGGRQRERRLALVDAAAKLDGDAALGKRPGLLHPADRLASPFQRRKGRLACARGIIAAAGSNVERRRGPGDVPRGHTDHHGKTRVSHRLHERLSRENSRKQVIENPPRRR